MWKVLLGVSFLWKKTNSAHLQTFGIVPWVVWTHWPLSCLISNSERRSHATQTGYNIFHCCVCSQFCYPSLMKPSLETGYNINIMNSSEHFEANWLIFSFYFDLLYLLHKTCSEVLRSSLRHMITYHVSTTHRTEKTTHLTTWAILLVLDLTGIRFKALRKENTLAAWCHQHTLHQHHLQQKFFSPTVRKAAATNYSLPRGSLTSAIPQHHAGVGTLEVDGVQNSQHQRHFAFGQQSPASLKWHKRTGMLKWKLGPTSADTGTPKQCACRLRRRI